MYEGGMHQFEPWEAPPLEEQQEDMNAKWDQETIRQLAEALRRVLATGLNGGGPIRFAMGIAKNGRPLDDKDIELATASEAAMEAARMALRRVESADTTADKTE